MKMIDEFKKVDPLLIMKSAVGSTLAIIIASRFNLLYSVTAGIITLLTIQNTRKETLEIALKRVAAFIVAMLLAYASYRFFGFTTIAFGVFVFFFVALANLLRIQVGITMNAVLVTHFLVEQRMDFPLIVNEALILLIGMSIGVLVNLIMMSNIEEIKKEQKIVEDRMKETINCMARMLRRRQDCGYVQAQREQIDLINLEALIDRLLDKAYEEAGNNLLSETRYRISYLEMRKLQLDILSDIRKSIEDIHDVLPQGIELSDYMKKMSDEFTEENNVKTLLEELDALYEYFRREELPKTRNEFENRAILFNISRDLESFLEIKRTFVERN